MRPGDVLEDRFELELLAGSGGMGEVFRARDRASGGAVAIKVLLSEHVPDRARFAREARVLAELAHPGIVRYVAHGLSPSGPPFLAMEWLEGEDLSARLRRGMLAVEETVKLGVQVAEALSFLHARGVVHRDLKPSNLFLIEQDLERVKVLDFGIARLGDATRVTKTGALLGTPGYMAPEQARSGQDVDARADIFALGCVLFKCLTGTPAFTGHQVMTILAKILFEDAPRVWTLRPDVPPALDALIARMLAKDREERPRDAEALAAAFAALAAEGPLSSEPAPWSIGRQETALTGGERRVLSVVLLGNPAVSFESETRTLVEGALWVSERALRQALSAHGGDPGVLADDSVIVTFSDSSPIATDQAAQAARAALALHAVSPERPIALATGRAEVTGKLPVGEVIERAARMVVTLKSSPVDALEAGRARPIGLDDVTAGLLDARFEVHEGAQGFELHGEHELVEGARTLLGKATTCVGREWEFGALEALLHECVEEPAARVLLVTAPAGMGKSRLAHEFIQRVRQRGTGMAIWSGRVDSLRAGSTFGLLGQALRGAMRIQEGEPLEARRQKLKARVAEHVAESEQRRVEDFLGELVGTPFPDEESILLRAARQDAQLMGDQMCGAFLDFLRAEAAVCPVLLVLEDLHWGDLATACFIDAALRDLRDQPFMVLALARPEVHDLFPKLWAARGVQEIRLKELSRRASERLVRQVLGDGVGKETVERIVTQAEGHAFCLEELIRAAAEGKGEALPETVLAMVEARLARLESDARRVLRAASVFGEVFWLGGILALLGGSKRAPEVSEWLRQLVGREVLVRRGASRFPGEEEFAFRHALLREGAYAMLTEEDRALGHLLAASFLDPRGEPDPMVLAEHLERGRDLIRAGSFYLRAAEQAQRGSDTNAVIARAGRGLRCGVPSAVRVSLLGLLSEAHGWRNEWAEASTYVEEAMRLSAPGSTPWVRAVPAKLSVALHLGKLTDFMATLRVVQEIAPSPEALGPLSLALAAASYFLDSTGQFDPGEVTLRRLRAVVEPVADREPVCRAWMLLSHVYQEAWVKEDPWASLRQAEAARASFQEAGHWRGALVSQVFIGMNAWSLGDFTRAERELRGTLVADEEFGPISWLRTFLLIEVLIDRGAMVDARLEATKMIEAGRARQNPLQEGRARSALADLLCRSGDLGHAEDQAHAALALLSTLPLDHLAATATLAAIRLARGGIGEALTAAEQVISRYETLRAFGFKGAFARLIHAEALRAAGCAERARGAITVGRDRLLANAAKIGDPAYQKTFLENVPENARTLALARAWLGEDEDAPAV